MENKVREEHRPWGFYEVLSDEMASHKVKRITVWPGKRLSLQYHHKRREHWIVVSGTGIVTVDGIELNLGPGQSVDIPHRAPHRMENAGSGPLVFIEVQQGEYFGEDDIVRMEDDFGRT
jgi:mannose-6-phosphate isomerase